MAGERRHKLHKKALAHLRRDEVMRRLIKKYAEPYWQEKEDLFQALTYEIVGQQLSNKVAKVIYDRFTKLFKNGIPNARELQKISDQKIRDAGCSWAKVKYLKSLAQAVDSGELNLESIHRLTDEEVYAQLTKVKGIGSWTAEMFLIFSLHRPDVFSLGDLGLRTAVAKLYGVKRTSLKKIQKISETWKPYRSFASRYLWSSLLNE